MFKNGIQWLNVKIQMLIYNTQTNAIVYKSKHSTDIVRKLYMYMYKQQLMRTNSFSLRFCNYIIFNDFF